MVSTRVRNDPAECVGGQFFYQNNGLTYIAAVLAGGGDTKGQGNAHNLYMETRTGFRVGKLPIHIQTYKYVGGSSLGVASRPQVT